MAMLKTSISSLARSVVVLAVLANSGLGVELADCPMQGEACCEQAVLSAASDCTESSLQHTILLGRTGVSCHTTKVMGSLTANPALVQKESRATTYRPGPSANISHASNFDIQSDFPTSLFSSILERGAPRVVKKYILDASFLI